MLTSINYCDVEIINLNNRKIGAAEINISGRQRMLSQRTAFFVLRLVHCNDLIESGRLRSELRKTIDLMDKSHQILLNGDLSLNISSQLSPRIRAIYFEPPFQLDQQVRDYIKAVRSLLLIEPEKLTPNHPCLTHIIEAASGVLLAGLDAVVNQYQQEIEATELQRELEHAELYYQSCQAVAIAQEKNQELEKIMAELQAAQSQLIQIEKLSSLGQMVAGIAHEINNPVSYIYGNLSHAEVYIQDLLNLLRLYQEAYPDATPEIKEEEVDVELEFLVEDLPKVLTSMQIGADRIRQIVLSLRNFSRSDCQEFAPTNLHEGIDTTILILQHRLKAQSDRPEIVIIKEYGKIPAVECYSGQINQVFMNFLSNAIDALEEYYQTQSKGGLVVDQPRIKVKTELVTSEEVRVIISDNGPGMSEAVKSHLFETFFTTKPQGKGTGLGLSISQEIIHKHHGNIRCESEFGQGTSFIINLPVKHSKPVNS